MMETGTRQQGFTLTELMITVALIGVMASIAVPSFMSYQAKTRRSEAFSNLAAMATTYHAFYSEQGFYPDMFSAASAAWLPNVALATLSASKADWDITPETQAFFDLVGFQIDGDVWHVYDITAPPSASCSGCSNCFTLTAIGNTDGDSSPGVVMYSHPERDAGGAVVGQCTNFVNGYSAPGGLFDQPAVQPLADEF